MKILCLILLLSGISLSAQTIALPPGDGTPGNPFRIATLEHLQWMAITPSSWNHHFEQVNDIDASDTKNWNNGEGWIPIGWEVPFTGSYNGKGHAIQHLYLNKNEFGSHIGFFAHIEGANLSNMNLVKIKLEAYSKDRQFNMAGLVGNAVNATIKNCYVSGTLHNNGGFNKVDKLIGQNDGGTVSGCSTDLEIIN
ncbi:GLUG motif-containing protein [Anditalea andensis]|uniref:GLUG motif-containing protein n=1 Tax=Anditalea andensis TaxID=1048983 RepID=UPI0013E0B88A|nr:GLUG motif-containing protein [Anditalea andensis]